MILDPRSDTYVRDTLALDRTRLANERTLLAYIRTALAVAVVGATLIQFFASRSARITGGAFVVVAGLMVVLGAIRYRRMQMKLKKHSDIDMP